MSERLRILIVGGGIGGLALAALLRQREVAVDLVELAPRFAPVGAGIALAINALAILRGLGCQDALLEDGFEIGRASITDRRGRVLATTDLRALRDRYGPSVAVHRASLHRVLLEAAQPERVILGSTIERLEQDETGVGVRFSHGTGGSYDVLIGADGLHSRTRSLLFGDTAERRYSGYTCWRFVLADALGISEVTEMWGHGRRFGIVPLGRGGLYCFATLNGPPGHEPFADLRHDHFRLLFREFGGEVPRILAALGADDPLIHNDLEDVRLDTWVRGRVALLGDAAHAMTPNLGQGAAMAIEDAAVLAELLAGERHDPARALERYEERRRPRVAKIQQRSWRFGVLAQWRSPPLCTLRNLALRVLPDRLAVRGAEHLLAEGDLSAAKAPNGRETSRISPGDSEDI